MCEPVSIAAMAVTAYSGYMQGRTQRAQGIAQGNYYDYVAEQSKIEAAEAIKAGNLQNKLIQDVSKEEGKQLKRSQAQLSAQQIADMASKGMDTSSVSAQDISNSTHGTQRLDELALRYNSDIKSWGVTTDASYKSWALNTKANEATYAGKNARWAGKLAMRNTYLQTGATLLTQAVGMGIGGSGGGGGALSSPKVLDGGGAFGNSISKGYASTIGTTSKSITSSPFTFGQGGLWAGVRQAGMSGAGVK